MLKKTVTSVPSTDLNTEENFYALKAFFKILHTNVIKQIKDWASEMYTFNFEIENAIKKKSSLPNR